MHAYPAPLAEAPATCAGGMAPPVQAALLPRQAMDYGLYVGCNPLCFGPASGG
jgi:hypothetical protein